MMLLILLYISLYYDYSKFLNIIYLKHLKCKKFLNFMRKMNYHIIRLDVQES